ncbi:MAG: ABC transporter substrate-binding protein [Halobacteriaceae archaeon]
MSGEDEGTARRRFLAALAGAGAAGLAGCGDGDGGDGTTASPTSGSTTASTTEPPPATTTQATTTEPSTTEPTTEPTTTVGLVEGRTWRMVVPPKERWREGYNPLRRDTFWWDGEAMLRQRLYDQSLVDRSIVPRAARELNYEEGVLRVDLHEDLYWASGSAEKRDPVNVTAADWVDAAWVLADVHAQGTVSDIERRGTYGFTVYFAEELRRNEALHRGAWGSAVAHGALGTGCNATFWQSSLQRYADASTEEERTRVWNDARDRRVESPHPVTSGPFRVASSEEDRLTLTLRDDEDPTPRGVAAPTFDTVEILVRDEASAQTQAFADGRLPFAGTVTEPAWGGGLHELAAFDESVVDVDVPFDTRVIELPRTMVTGCLMFNTAQPPADSVHFRRAVAYLANRETLGTRFSQADRLLTGFTTEQDETDLLSDGLLGALRNGPHGGYSVGTSDTERATAELQAGGFERDSEGRWLHRSGEFAGEPITLEVPLFPGSELVIDTFEQFVPTLTEFGIEATVVVDDMRAWEAWSGEGAALSMGRWGGRTPWRVYRAAFLGHPSFGDVNMPDVWEGPPVGDPATPPSVATDERTTFDVAALVDRLPTATDDRYASATDRLAWVFNQSVTRLPLGRVPLVYTVDTDSWDWPTPVAEHPEAWTGVPRQTWVHGTVDAVPEA